MAPVYPASLELLDLPGTFEIELLCLGDEYLIGLTAINRFRVTLDHGQRVIVEP